MATNDQIAASDLIKSCHKKLRKEAAVLGMEEAWRKHCSDEESLRQYAKAMHNLATNHWDNNYKKDSKGFSRVTWVYNYTQSYFLNGEKNRQKERELEIAQKLELVLDVELTNIIPRYELLDVGSCYNPFSNYDCFNVLPIDIAPATSDVYRCDFLNVKVSFKEGEIKKLDTDITISEFQADFFDIVVFSLFLEYLPSPNFRLICCQQAYKLLKNEGILFIITPDSKHVGANAKIMKSWRFILAKLGFSRIKYEKLTYLHCMVFRKSLKPEIAQRWANLQDESKFYKQFYIPQDLPSTDFEIETI